MNRFDARELAGIAASAPDLSSFAEETLDRLQQAVGFDVAYHAPVSGMPTFAARRGFSDQVAARILSGAATYGEELLPVKRAAHARGGVAIDSEVFTPAERAKLGYYTEVMAPDGGTHAMVALGLFGGAIVSITMLGRTGSAFSQAAVDLVRGLVPVIGVATRAHLVSVEERTTTAPSLSDRERDLVDYVALGFTNVDIGRVLGTSPRTVRNQLSTLYTRLGVANRAELVAVVPSGTRVRPYSGRG